MPELTKYDSVMLSPMPKKDVSKGPWLPQMQDNISLLTNISVLYLRSISCDQVDLVMMQSWPPPMDFEFLSNVAQPYWFEMSMCPLTVQFGMQGYAVQLRPTVRPSFIGNTVLVHLQHSLTSVLHYSVSNGLEGSIHCKFSFTVKARTKVYLVERFKDI